MKKAKLKNDSSVIKPSDLRNVVDNSETIKDIDD